MLKPITLLVALSLSLPTLAQSAAPAAQPASRGTALQAKAAALEAAGKYEEAGTAYHDARDAFMKEENYDAASKALAKVAEMMHKEFSVPPAPSKAAQPAVPAQPAAPVAVPNPAPTKAVNLPPMAPKAGTISGRAVLEGGGEVANFTIKYYGFEDGVLANTNAVGNLTETVGGVVKGVGGAYSVKVPPGAYRAVGRATYDYHGRSYTFDMEPLNLPAHHDYEGKELDKLRGGLVRDFVLKFTGKKPGASEDTATVYQDAYYGGRVDFKNGSSWDSFYGAKTAPEIGDAYSIDGSLEVTLTPQGPMVDGTTGQVVTTIVPFNEPMGWKYCRRGVYPGVYTATANVITPAGAKVPLRLSTKPADLINGKWVIEWKPAVTLDFLPNDLLPGIIFGLKDAVLFLGQ